MSHHELLWSVAKRLPDDYTPYGQKERWAEPDQEYPDCSSGCRFFYALKKRGGEPIGFDWGVCGNANSHRAGLLTFEHQGCQAFQPRGKQS